MSEIVPGSVGPRGDRSGARRDDARRDNVRPSDAHRDDAHRDDARRDNALRDDVRPGDASVGFGDADPITAGLLARYLVGRVVAARLSICLLVAALIFVAGGVALWAWGPRWLGVLAGLIGLAVLALRALIMAILRRVMGVGRLGPVEDKVRALVADSRGDLRRELKRVGLPASVVGMPLLVIRLFGRRRAATFARLRRFDVNRVVPRSRQDELHFLLTSQLRSR